LPLQRSLNKMVGQSSGYIESLPAPVRTRIQYLSELDGERAELHERFRCGSLSGSKRHSAGAICQPCLLLVTGLPACLRCQCLLGAGMAPVLVADGTFCWAWLHVACLPFPLLS
jgi:hypothetical protein